MDRHEIETQLIEKAGADPAFRRRLLDDPKGAIADLLGAALPPGMTITVLEEKPGQHYLVLPPAPPAIDALPLEDLELALVGGGRTLRPMEVLCGMTNVLSSNVRTENSTRTSC
ncbi:NHLP leader peptide family natural product precursor [bacterium]|nr:NHLP leader peptide family natural product precursor [bacterium]